jgi:hypothetical protein
LLILDRVAGAIATMAATNKCLAKSNKSYTGKATNKKRKLDNHRCSPMRDVHVIDPPTAWQSHHSTST